jgi:hypothetical protein
MPQIPCEGYWKEKTKLFALLFNNQAPAVNISNHHYLLLAETTTV